MSRAPVHCGWSLPSLLLPFHTHQRLLPHSPHHGLSRCRRKSQSSGGNDKIATVKAATSCSPGGCGAARAGAGRAAMGGGLTRWFGQALGQRLNLAGMAFFARVVATEEGRRLAVPHLRVPDVRWVDWGELEKLGFKGVVFDKDNTLTAPYSLSLWPPIAAALGRCVEAFPGRVAVFSNSAGLYQYDPDGSEAKALESIGGFHVIRHETKKPAGTVDDIEKYFGCPPSHLIMVGDRCFTDVVYGNQNGFLTILTEPLKLSEEPFIVQQVSLSQVFIFWYSFKFVDASGSYGLFVIEPLCDSGRIEGLGKVTTLQPICYDFWGFSCIELLRTNSCKNHPDVASNWTRAGRKMAVPTNLWIRRTGRTMFVVLILSIAGMRLDLFYQFFTGVLDTSTTDPKL